MLRTGIITSYLTLRLVVRRGFLNTYRPVGHDERQYEWLLQLRVLCFGFLQDGDVRVGVLPQREEILIRDAGFGGVALQSAGARNAEMGERADGSVLRHAAVIQNFMELSRRTHSSPHKRPQVAQFEPSLFSAALGLAMKCTLRDEVQILR